ncbi:RNA 2',3'-cyclic phosphodiesterase [Nocardioides sp. dk4132]|uniref:RNA 2',3'-cyclic phosphodiesterase n=1 Tax=unclassified Nocardioides TaxID=2615069 RepID=UPI00129561ED|nr:MULTISPECIES: RNA 2',3'-cyclic phosphodiesterase [unclassified Nocardioides]MQW77641.1 RNA 2',3'-cyclic phosphodiesterase [Nocardioides sp. dk4132]QGA06166.1 RNA 2',3'-cyclic phosphodiesterase [Nocardioides sp. dk884]
MRMFAAVVPPEEVVADLDAFLDVRRAAGPFRWAPAEQLHVTVAFYADVPERALDDLVERLGRAAAKRTPFTTAITGGGAFPHVAGARVIWAGLDLDEEGRTELDRLATGARAAANRAGVAVDGQRFRPHVTLARLRHPDDVSDWVRLLDTYGGPAWTVDRLRLIASHLGEGPRGRPRYELIDELPLTR